MNARSWLNGLTAALVLGSALYAAHAFRVHRHRREELARLHHRIEANNRLAAENARLHAALDSPGALADLQQERTQLSPLRRKLDAALFQLHDLQRAGGEKPPPVWPLGAEVLRAGDWRNVGATTAAAAMQSFMWAARTGDIAQLVSLITMEPGTRQHAAAAFAQLPASVQQQYGTPEQMVAMYVAAKIPDYDAMAEVDQVAANDTRATLRYRLEDSGGDQRNLNLMFQKAANGSWQLTIPQLAVALYVADLQGRSALK